MYDILLTRLHCLSGFASAVTQGVPLARAFFAQFLTLAAHSIFFSPQTKESLVQDWSSLKVERFSTPVSDRRRYPSGCTYEALQICDGLIKPFPWQLLRHSLTPSGLDFGCAALPAYQSPVSSENFHGGIWPPCQISGVSSVVTASRLPSNALSPQSCVRVITSVWPSEKVSRPLALSGVPQRLLPFLWPDPSMLLIS